MDFIEMDPIVCITAICSLHSQSVLPSTTHTCKRAWFRLGLRRIRSCPHYSCAFLLQSRIAAAMPLGYEGWKLPGILRNSPKPLPSFAMATEGFPRLHPRSLLRGIRHRRIMQARRHFHPLTTWRPLHKMPSFNTS